MSNIQIEVVYGTPEQQLILVIDVPAETCVEDAIKASDIIQHFPEIDLAVNKVGVWNRTCKLTDTLKSGDRIEVYRPLIADPKEVRRQRAERAKEEGRADKVTGGRARRANRESAEKTEAHCDDQPASAKTIDK